LAVDKVTTRIRPSPGTVKRHGSAEKLPQCQRGTKKLGRCFAMFLPLLRASVAGFPGFLCVLCDLCVEIL